MGAVIALFLAVPMIEPAVADTSLEAGSVRDLLNRVRSDPPAWGDLDRFGEWLSVYGPVEKTQSQHCRASATVDEPESLPAFSFIFASVRDPCRSTPTDGPPSNIFLQAVENGTFDETAATNAITAVLGPPEAACTNDDRTVWYMSESVTLSLVAPLWPSYGIMILHTGLQHLDCQGEPSRPL